MVEAVTPLRRSTRSVKAEPVTPPAPGSSQSANKRSLTASLQKFAYDSPSKKVKLEANAESLRSPPLVAVELDEKPKRKTASKKPVIQLALDKPHPAPKNWERQYELIEKMRKGIVAPVDDMLVILFCCCNADSIGDASGLEQPLMLTLRCGDAWVALT